MALKVEDNALVHVSPDGRVLKRISLSTLFAEDPSYKRKLKEAYNELKSFEQNSSKGEVEVPRFDLFHANNIENLEWDIPGIAKKGDWLVTLRHLDRVIIVDSEREKIIWQWGEGVIDKPHHATFLKEDQILLFDNGVNKKFSRVIVLDMRSEKIVWQYGQKSGQEFFTPKRGSVQRLPNGNTLISESDRGRVFEVTLSGEIVWEWYAEFSREEAGQGKRRIVPRMERLSYDFFKGIEFNYGKTKF
ncbi:MAG: hypothetical protein HQL21_05290 [Candidatus Omnitrophica bacterium]|nr:hypothetical protein [Candidatus Omnitrophota bacterium]